MVRYIAMGLALIASLGQLLPIALLALLVPSCIYLARFRILWPVGSLIPPIVATFVVFYPFWVLAMVSNSYLRSVNGIKGVVEEEGVRLNGRSCRTVVGCRGRKSGQSDGGRRHRSGAIISSIYETGRRSVSISSPSICHRKRASKCGVG